MANSLLIRCMDHRLPGPVVEWMKSEGLLGSCYDPSYGGGCQRIAQGDSPLLSFIEEDIEIGCEKGQVSKAILMNHTDCAAYGGSNRFKSLDEERAFHAEELQRAEKVILSRFPQLTVRKILAIVEGEKVLGFHEV